MRILIQNSQTGTIITLDVDVKKTMREVIDLLIQRKDIKRSKKLSFALVLMGKPLGLDISIEDAVNKHGLRENSLIVLLEREKTQQVEPPIIAEKSEEENIFDDLMGLPTSVPEEPTPTIEPLAPVEAIAVAAAEDPKELLEIHGKILESKMRGLLPFDNLERFLNNKLGPSFQKIRGAWTQLTAKQIEPADFIRAGIFVLRKAFVDIFLEVAEPTPVKVEAQTPEISEDPSSLFEEHGTRIVVALSSKLPINNLEQFLNDKLGSSFQKLRGAWAQMSSGEISLNDFARAGIFLLKKEFANLFIEPSPEPSIGTSIGVTEASGDVGPATTAQNRDTFSEDPFSTVPATIDQSPDIFSEDPFSKVPESQELESNNDQPAPSIPEPALSTPEVEEEVRIFMPSLLFQSENDEDDDDKDLTLEKISPPEPEIEIKPVKRPSLKIESVQSPKLRIEPANKPPQDFKVKKSPSEGIGAFGKVEPVKVPRKIEHIAAKKISRSELESLKLIGSELERVELQPMKFDLIEEAELRVLNVGASLPGSEFEEIRAHIYSGEHELATKMLMQVKSMAESRNDEFAISKAEDLLTNMSIYPMIPVLIDAGDKLLNLNEPRKAKEKYKKAEKFAKTINDDHYVSKIRKRLAQVDQRVMFIKTKKEAELNKDLQLRELIKANIVRLGKTETLKNIAEIRKYCQVNKPIEFIIEVLIEMIENREIYAKYFPESNNVMFDKDSNREFILKRR